MYVYDSFEGLPESDMTRFNGLFSTSVDSLKETFINSKVPLPVICQGWFNNLGPTDLPKKIAFAHLDGDLYSSTYDSLNLIYELLVKDAIILIDDYDSKEWPGVKNAVDEFFFDKPETIISLPGVNGKPGHKALIKKI
jgi:O-methyltransferase